MNLEQHWEQADLSQGRNVGMTLRDYVICVALAGLLADVDLNIPHAELAEKAVSIADATIYQMDLEIASGNGHV
jgi:hypothetical protein